MEEGRERGPGTVLKTFCCLFGEVILANKGFEKGDQLVLGDIAAVGLWKKREMGNRAIRIEIKIHPELHPFNIKIDLCGEIFNIHKELAPSFIGHIDVVVKNRHKHFRMLLGEFEIAVFVLPNEEDLRQC